jgi:transcriptional regulator, GntR family
MSRRRHGSNGALRIHGSIARDIGVRIVSGRYNPGHVLAGEVEASEKLRVSRTAYREAVRILAAKGLVHSRPRTGTRVSSPEEWHLLDPDVLSWAFSDDPEPEVLHGLFELRSIIEPDAAALAAVRRTQKQLDAMSKALDSMRAHTLNTEEGRIADKQFHGALLRATFNPFIISLTNGVTAAVEALTEFKIRGSALKRDSLPGSRACFRGDRRQGLPIELARHGGPHSPRHHGYPDEAAPQILRYEPLHPRSRRVIALQGSSVCGYHQLIV